MQVLWREADGYKGISFSKHLFHDFFFMIFHLAQKLKGTWWGFFPLPSLQFEFLSYLQASKLCVTTGLSRETWDALMVGLDDLRGLFQPMILWFYDLQRQQCRGTESPEAAEACMPHPAAILWKDAIMQGQITFQENNQPESIWFCLKTWLHTCICSLKTKGFLHHFCPYRPGLLEGKWCLKRNLHHINPRSVFLRRLNYFWCASRNKLWKQPRDSRWPAAALGWASHNK